MLLAIALRIGKSLFYFLMNDMAPVGLAFGFFGLASIGPLLWLFTNNSHGSLWKNAWHFMIAFFGAIACYIVSPSPLETYLYQFATAVLMVYLIFSTVRLFEAERGANKGWTIKVLIMVVGVWIAFVYQHLSNSMMDYARGAIIASIFLYWIFFQSFKTGVIPKGISITPPDQMIGKVRDALEHQSLFKEQGMTLQRFAAQLDVPPYLVTRIVKQLYDRSFPETLNHFRVEAVKQMLLDPNMEHFKIESLAYEVGFTSPSAFYTAFKKCTGQTPTAYQRESALLSA